jgi:hypothetical protein
VPSGENRTGGTTRWADLRIFELKCACKLWALARIGGFVDINEVLASRGEADDALPPDLGVVEEPPNIFAVTRLHLGNIIRVGPIALIPYATLLEESLLAFGHIHGIKIPSVIATKVGVGLYCEGVCPFKEDEAFPDPLDKPGTMLHLLDLGVDGSIDKIDIDRRGAEAAFVRSDTGAAILRIHAYVARPGIVAQKPVRVDAGDNHFVLGRHLSGVFSNDVGAAAWEARDDEDRDVVGDGQDRRPRLIANLAGRRDLDAGRATGASVPAGTIAPPSTSISAGGNVISGMSWSASAEPTAASVGGESASP